MIQQITEELNRRGLRLDIRDTIIKELESKSENVQRTFYLRSRGYKQKEIAEMLMVSEARVSQYLSQNLQKVHDILVLATAMADQDKEEAHRRYQHEGEPLTWRRPLSGAERRLRYLQFKNFTEDS